MNPLLGAILSGRTGAIISAVIVFFAVLACVAMIIVIFGRRPQSVSSQIEAYDWSSGESSDGRDSNAFESNFMNAAVDATERLANRFGVMGRIESTLEQSEIPLRSGEIVFLAVVGTLVIGLIGFILSANLLVALILMAFAGAVPLLLLSRKRSSILRRFEEQLPDVLTLLAGTLRSGFSLLQGLEATAAEAPEPAGRELRRAYQETRMGKSVQESLNDVADRMESQDLGWTVVAIGIQQDVGGNLAELLDSVASTMNQRERLRREVRALTGEGRISALVLFLFPPGFTMLMYGMQPEYISKLFANTGGIIASVVAATLMVLGGLWLKRIVRLDV